MKLAELEEEMRHRQATILRLEEEVSELQRGVNDMSRELEAKGKEILSIRSEANKTLK